MIKQNCFFLCSIASCYCYCYCSIDDQKELLLPVWRKGSIGSINNNFDRIALSPQSTLHILQLFWISFFTEYHWLLDKPAASESRSSCCKRRWTLQGSTHRRCPCQSPAHEGMAGNFRVFSKKRICFLGCLIIKFTTNNSLYPLSKQITTFSFHLKQFLSSLFGACDRLRVPILVVTDHTWDLLFSSSIFLWSFNLFWHDKILQDNLV